MRLSLRKIDFDFHEISIMKRHLILFQPLQNQPLQFQFFGTFEIVNCNIILVVSLMDLLAGHVLQQLILSSRFRNLNFPNTKSSFIAKISSFFKFLVGPRAVILRVDKNSDL